MVCLFPSCLSPTLTRRVLKVPPPRKKSKRKRGPDIMDEIPLHGDELFHEVTVTRHKKRLQTTSKPVCIPLPPTVHRVEPVLDTPEQDGDVYSDAEGSELLPATPSRERKGPSRSVSVCNIRLFIYHIYFYLHC